jgi:hypothetical protein
MFLVVNSADARKVVSLVSVITQHCPDTHSMNCDATGGAGTADILCEDMQGSYDISSGPQNEACWGPDNAWGAVEFDTGTVTSAAISGTLSCTDKGTNAIQFYQTGDDYAYIVETGFSLTEVNTTFYFNMVSESMGDGNSQEFFHLRDDGSAAELQLWFIEESGPGTDITIRTRYQNSGTNNDNDTTAISTGTWYEITVEWVSGSLLEVKLNGNQIAYQTTIDSDIVTQLRYGFGSGSSNFGAMTLQMINIAADDDTVPGSCTGWSP